MYDLNYIIIIISMFLNQVVIAFTDSQKYELQNIINSFKIQSKDNKEGQHRHSQIRQDVQFKESIVSFIKSKKNDLQEKNQYINRIKEFLIQQGCIEVGQSTISQQFTHNQLYDGLQNLHLKIIQNSKNQQIFQLFVAFLEEMKDLKQEQIYQFQYKLSKASKLNRIQRQILAFIAKKLIKVQRWAKMSDIEDQICLFFAKIMYSGIHQQVSKQIQKISSPQIRNKSYRLIEYLQNNCIQIKRQFSPVLSVLKKLCTSIYDKYEIQRSLSELPQNIRLIFQPICFQIFRLRQQSKMPKIGDQIVSKKENHKYQISQLQLKQQCQAWKYKSLNYETQLKKLKFILQKLSYLNNLFREQALYQEIQKQLASSSQQIKIYLQRIYNHLKDHEELSKGKKMSFVQRKDKQIEFLQEKLRNALQELDLLKQAKNMSMFEQSLLLDQNSFLKKQSCQNLQAMDQYYRQVNNLNAEVGKLSKQIVQNNQKLQGKINQKIEMQKKIQDLILQKQRIGKQLGLMELNLTNNLNQFAILKRQNQQLKKNSQQINAQINQLKQVLKEADKCKYFQAENNNFQHQQTQTISEQGKTSLNIKQISSQLHIKQKQDKIHIQQLKIENDSLKQQRVFRINQEKQMKRLYRDQQQEINQINTKLNQYRQKYQNLLKQYNNLKNTKDSSQRDKMKASNIVHPNLTSSQVRQKQTNKKLQQQYKILHNNFEQLKQFNDFLKVQNQKLKDKFNNQFKFKINQVIAQSKQNQSNVLKELSMLRNKNKQLQTKIQILQEQNLNIKLQIHISNIATNQHNKQKKLNTSSYTPTNDKRTISEQQRLRNQVKQINIRNEQQRIKMMKDIKIKEEQISLQRIQILKLQQRLDNIIIPNKGNS